LGELGISRTFGSSHGTRRQREPHAHFLCPVISQNFKRAVST
jgi:hypothetical protein